MPPVVSPIDLAVAAAPRGPVDLADTGPLVKRIREGLEVLLDRGGIDARASRQKGEVQYKGKALSVFRGDWEGEPWEVVGEGEGSGGDDGGRSVEEGSVLVWRIDY
jgi:hypothetical protein